MSTKPITIAFVSGKGGVGKTMLAANFAWVCSHLAKTIVVDLDFQNQGCTGLFAPHINFGRGNALEAIVNPENDTLQEINKVETGRLCFLPAVSWQQRPSQEEILRYVNAADFQDKLAAFIQQLMLQHAFEIVILDCHGGTDAVSFAAFQSSDQTLMVTEADSVTFAGTLELLSYYESKYNEKRSSFTSNEPSDQPQQMPTGKKETENSPCVKFIVNRLPGKYRWKDLEHIYKQYTKRKLGIFTPEKSIFCYIPIEELLVDSFGEYPFHVKLAPKSIFSRKVNYMVYSILSKKFEVPSFFKPLLKFKKQRYLRKIEKIVVSNEHKNMGSILKFFAWASTLYALFLMTFMVSGFISGLKKTPTSPDIFFKSILAKHSYILYGLGGVIITGIMWYGLKALFGLMSLYKNKHRYQKALFRSLAPKLTLWQRLSLFKLFVLRIGTSFLPYLTAFMLPFMIIGLLSAYTGPTLYKNQKRKDKKYSASAPFPKVNAQSYYQLGIKLAKEGKREESVKFLLKAIELDSQYATHRSYGYIGDTYYHLGKYEKAIKYYQKAIELNPKPASDYTSLGLAFGYLGKHEEAIKYCQKSIELDPKGSARGHICVGAAYSSLGKHENAINSYEKAIELNPEITPTAYTYIGANYSSMGKHKEAVEILQKAIKKDPNYVSAYTILGNVYYKDNNHDKAIEYYKKSIDMGSNDSTVYYNLACAYSLKKDKNTALKYLKQTINNGYNDLKHIENDSDFDYIRNTQKYQHLIDNLKNELDRSPHPS